MEQQKLKFFEVPHRSPEYEAALQLRQEVLRAPLGLAYSLEQIAAEATETHLIAMLNGQVVASISIVWNPEHARLRQMAVAQECRGQGVGAALLREAEALAIRRGLSKTELHARVAALGFYLKAGYRIASEEYLEVGLPHKTMVKDLF